jgi:hypothetical protein
MKAADGPGDTRVVGSLQRESDMKRDLTRPQEIGCRLVTAAVFGFIGWVIGGTAGLLGCATLTFAMLMAPLRRELNFGGLQNSARTSERYQAAAG